jgi:esterase/lipase
MEDIPEICSCGARLSETVRAQLKQNQSLKKEVDDVKKTWAEENVELTQCLKKAEDVLDSISSQSNPSFLDQLVKKYYDWKHEQQTKRSMS